MVSQTPFRAAEFRSAFGPKYSFQPQYRGINAQTAIRYGWRTASIGGGLGVALLLFASSLPRVRADILSKVPVVGKYFEKKEPHPADNPF
ncbi:ubiquinol-cytochrome-c reductase complex subunit domain-containing protein [Trichoderma novae-zelandiae]